MLGTRLDRWHWFHYKNLTIWTQQLLTGDSETEMPLLCLCSPAYEWQGHKKTLHPVSVEVDEKRGLQVFDRSGSSLRYLFLGDQDYLDIRLSKDRQRKALLLKVPKEYDLVSGSKLEVIVYNFRAWSENKTRCKRSRWWWDKHTAKYI